MMRIFMYLYIGKAGSTFILPLKTRYTNSEYSHIGNPISRRLDNTPARPSSFITPPVTVNTLNMGGLKLNEAKSELEPVQDIQFLGLCLRLDQG